MDPIVLKQREFYKQHKTLDINFRINALKTLKKAMKTELMKLLKWMLENQILKLICAKLG